MRSTGHHHALHDSVYRNAALLPEGIIGVDAGLTLTKTVRSDGTGVVCAARETADGADDARRTHDARRIGVTGARDPSLGSVESVVVAQEIDAAARGVIALLSAEGRRPSSPFVVALLGTGTAFALVRDPASAATAHLGGTPLGGGSFTGIARRVAPWLSYDDLIAAAERGDRRCADIMVSDAYPEGIGRIGPDLTAAHVSKSDASLDDFLAGLLNLHGENIAQIAASRAIIADARQVVLAGGFVHNNAQLTAAVVSMAALFGVRVEVSPVPGYAGALGAALIAADTLEERSE